MDTEYSVIDISGPAAGDTRLGVLLVVINVLNISCSPRGELDRVRRAGGVRIGVGIMYFRRSCPCHRLNSTSCHFREEALAFFRDLQSL